MVVYSRYCIFLLLLLGGVNGSGGFIAHSPTSVTVQAGEWANFTCNVTLQEDRCPTVYWFLADGNHFIRNSSTHMISPTYFTPGHGISTLSILANQSTELQCARLHRMRVIYSKLALLVVEQNASLTVTLPPTPLPCLTPSPSPTRTTSGITTTETTTVYLTRMPATCTLIAAASATPEPSLVPSPTNSAQLRNTANALYVCSFIIMAAVMRF